MKWLLLHNPLRSEQGPRKRWALAVLARLTRAGTSNAAWAAGGSGFALVYALASQVLLSRMLPPERYGAFLLLSTLVFGATLFGLLGTDKMVVRRIAEALACGDSGGAGTIAERAIASVLLRATAIAALTLASAHAVAALGHGGVIDVFTSYSALLVALWIPAHATNLLVAEIHRGYQDIRRASLYGALPGALTLVGLLGIYAAGERTLAVAVSCVVASAVLAAVCALASMARVAARRDGAREPQAIASLVSPAVTAADFVFYAFANLGIWMLGALMSPQAVASFGVATRLAAVVAFPGMVANLLLPPMIAQLASVRKNQELETLMRAFATWTAAPALLLCAFYALYGRAILGTVFGAYYVSDWGLLLLLSCGQFANLAAGSCGYALVMTGHQRLVLVASAISLLVVVALGAVLVPGHGESGMAVAITIGLLLQNGLNLASARRKLGIWTCLRLTPPRGPHAN